MTPLFIYLLKVNIALILFYLVYHYGLRKLTFYTLNRYYLLFAIGFSSFYPLIDLSDLIKQQQTAAGEIIYYLPDLGSIAAESPLPIWNVLTFIFWSGVVVMGTRFLMQLVSLGRLHLASRKIGGGKPRRSKPSAPAGFRHTSLQLAARRSIVRIIKEKINPFSFFRSIYINPLQHPPAERASIIEHEQVHVKEWHSLDILAGELNRIFYWFNPGAWLMMTAIRENLEFIADQKVLQSGVDAKDYQYSLVKVSEIPYASSLANNFNFSHLKIRITMMDKKPSSELHLVKYLVLVPFVAAIAFAFNVPDTKPVPGNDNTAFVTDTIPGEHQIIIYDGEDNSGKALSDTISFPPSGKLSIKATADSVRKLLSKDETKAGVLKFLDTDSSISKSADRFTVSKEGITIVSSTTNQDTEVMLESGKTLILIDGNESDYATLQRLSRDKIHHWSAVSGKAARKTYGKKGEYGVIKITTKEAKK